MKKILALLLFVASAWAEVETFPLEQKYIPAMTYNTDNITVSSTAVYAFFTGTGVFVNSFEVNSTATFMSVAISTDKTGNIATSSMTASDWVLQINGGVTDSEKRFGWSVPVYSTGSDVTMRWSSGNQGVYFPFVRLSVKPNGADTDTFALDASVVEWSVDKSTYVPPRGISIGYRGR